MLSYSEELRHSWGVPSPCMLHLVDVGKPSSMHGCDAEDHFPPDARAGTAPAHETLLGDTALPGLAFTSDHHQMSMALMQARRKRDNQHPADGYTAISSCCLRHPGAIRP